MASKGTRIHLSMNEWRDSFKKALENAIAAEIGYGLDRYGGKASPGVMKKRRLAMLVDQRKNIIKFRNSFVLLCRRHGLLHDDLKWVVKLEGNLPAKMTSACRHFVGVVHSLGLKVTKEYDHSRAVFGNSRRPRVPTEVAFHIARLLESRKGNRAEADNLKSLIERSGELNLLVREIADKAKKQAEKRLEEYLKKAQRSLRLSKTTAAERSKLKAAVISLSRELREVRRFEVRWNPFDVSRDFKPNWINQMKQQMMDSILADGEPTIRPKHQSDRRRRKKDALSDAIVSGRYEDFEKLEALRLENKK